MRIKSFIVFLSLSVATWAQSPIEDQVTFDAAVDWLSAKLDYVYFEESSQKWWTNTFYINEDKEITIKQISSKVRTTANIKSKNYTVRTFNIKDINPYSINIREVSAGSGRFASGKLLEIHTLDGNPSISKIINNRKATSTSYLHLSFPKSLTDSLTNYPELVKEKLYEAVIAATKIYAAKPHENRQSIFNILQGQFHSETGQEWEIYELFPGVLKIEGQNTEKFLTYTVKNDRYQLTDVSDKGVVFTNYRIKEGVPLILEDINNPSHSIYFKTVNSFQLNEEWFYRH